ncbi:hypothetical protein B7463_g5328, partial [Scytalidium lignicola]
MPNLSIKGVEDLNAGEVELLTQLLSLPPGQVPTEQWLLDQETCLSQFPPQLLRPKSVLSRLSIKIDIAFKTESNPHLCHSHKTLNPHLIHTIFLLVATEATTRLGSIARNTERLPPNVYSFLKRLQMINSIWMDEDLYRVTFDATPYDARYERFPSGCEACILAAVGGNQTIISDLRAAILGRKRKRQKRESRLLKIVEGWMDWTGRGEELRSSSLELGREIRDFRKMLMAEKDERREKEKATAKVKVRRRRKRAGRESGTMPLLQNEMKDENNSYGRHGNKDQKKGNYEHGVEDAILDYYANLTSRADFNPDANIDDTILSISRSLEHMDISPDVENCSESNYSKLEVEEISMPLGEIKSTVERLSKMYRNLVEVDGERS